MADDYTPTTDEVRSGYGRDDAVRPVTSRRLHVQFDRWLAAHDAELLARVQPSREEVAYAIASKLWDEDTGDVEPWHDLTATEQENVVENYDAWRAADAVLALLPGRTEAEVRAAERERVISLLIGPSAFLDASVRAFKTGWHQADAEGRSGERVASGLRHVVEERIEKGAHRG